MLTLSPTLLDETLNISYQAGKYLVDFYQKFKESAVNVEHKLDNTPVTEVDLCLSQFLIEKLTALTPHVPILSEEQCKIPFAERRQWDEYWLIDPLDGTQQFINRTDHFAILITLVQKQQPVLGIIYVPILKTIYYAMQGVGAYKKVGDDIIKLASQCPPHKRAIKIGVGAESTQRKVQPLLNPNYQYEFLIYGSCGLKSGLVADGTCDCYVRFGSTGEWDTAPAEVLLAEIGGQVFDFDFQPLTYNQKAHFTNPNFVMVANSAFDWHKIFQFNA